QPVHHRFLRPRARLPAQQRRQRHLVPGRHLCNGAESCQSGTCTAGTPLNCNDGNACTTDACNAINGCTHTPIAGCQSCSVPADCNDSNPCTTDSCTAGTAVNSDDRNGSSGADWNACNGGEPGHAGAGV